MSLLRRLFDAIFGRRPRNAVDAIEAELLRLHEFLEFNPSRTGDVLEPIRQLHDKLIEIADRKGPI